MSRQRATFGKLQRERDKQAKAKAKREQRQALAEAAAHPEPSPEQTVTEAPEVLFERIPDLHRRFENGEISLEDYEEQKAVLLSQLPID